MSYDPLVWSYQNRFQLLVTWVDHGATINDEHQQGVLESVSPQTGLNYHIGGFKFTGGIAYNVLVPQDLIGSFKLPQVGDVVWVEESRRSNDQTPVYVFSSYSENVHGNPIPAWGSMHGDYGHLRSHADHTDQFLATTEDADFRTKFVRSITGHRFRKYYRSNLERGKFVVRGDPVFDVEAGEVNRPYLINEGSSLIHGGGVEQDKGKYPEPLNVPKTREKDEAFTYMNVLYRPLGAELTADAYDLVPNTAKTNPVVYKNVLKNKDYVAYEPVMDKTHLDKAQYEREMPAAEEYHVAVRGNNKLLIQDQYGDGEQLLITLKNQYDGQFTIVHNAERGQVRIRDHLGQGVLLDADPEAPRVVSWTANKQVIEQGSVKDVGEFTYIRNGSAFGDSQTKFGTKTGVTKDEVPNQELLMASTADIIGELSSRLSSGMNNLAMLAYSPGIYFRNNEDPMQKEQSFAMFSKDDSATITMGQTLGLNGIQEFSSMTQTLTGLAVTQELSLNHTTPGDEHVYTETVTVSGDSYSKVTQGAKAGAAEDNIVTTESITGDNTAIATQTVTTKSGSIISVVNDAAVPSFVTKVTEEGNELHQITQDGSGVSIERLAGGLALPITVGSDSGTGPITVGNSSGVLNMTGSAVNINGTAVTITGTTVDVNSPGP